MKIYRENYVALALIIISVIALWETRGLNEMSAVFPQVIAGIMLFLSAIYLIKSFIVIDDSKVFTGIDKKRVSTMFIGLGIYTFLIWLIGFLLASVIYITFFVWYLQEKETRRLSKAAISSVLFCTGFFLLFKYVLAVPLPTGILFT